MSTETYLPIVDLGERAGVGRDRIRAWLKTEGIETVKVPSGKQRGRREVEAIRLADAERFIAANSENGSQKPADPAKELDGVDAALATLEASIKQLRKALRRHDHLVADEAVRVFVESLATGVRGAR